MEFKFKLEDLNDSTKARLRTAGWYLHIGGWVVFSAYLLASFINTAIVPALIVSDPSGGQMPSFGRTNLAIRRNINYLDLRRSILDRNLFNKEGELPDETDPAADDGSKPQGGDIASQPCSKSSLPIELVGTIYLGETGDSLATVQERGYTQADVYRKGDSIIGHEQAKIYKVEQKRLIINNDGRKECFELKDPLPPASDGTYVAGPANNAGAPPPLEGDCGNIVLKEDYVKNELGPDFQEILKKGRLIPHERGFKLIGVNKNSLFGKVCLNNGDILTQINDISMQEPDKGFTFYKVFQDEREIRISLLRDGSNPMTINVQIE